MKTNAPSHSFPAHAAFTLIEIMVVVGIMGVILMMGAPSFLRMWQKEGMRKAVSNVVEVCGNARAQAILRGTEMDVVFHPREHRFEIASGGENAPPQPPTGGDTGAEKPQEAPKTGQAGQLPAGIDIEMLDINFMEYRESEWARVRFFPNGTSFEMTLILRSDKNQWCKISTEAVTGLVTTGGIQ